MTKIAVPPCSALACFERVKLTCTCSSSMLSSGSTKSIISLRQRCQLNRQGSEISRLGTNRKSPLYHSPATTGQNMAMGYIRICWKFADIPAFLSMKLTDGQQEDDPTGTTLVSPNQRGLSMLVRSI